MGDETSVRAFYKKLVALRKALPVISEGKIEFILRDDPQVLGICIINHPQGVYYGGTIAAPVIQRIFANILPYLGIEADINEEKKTEND